MIGTLTSAITLALCFSGMALLSLAMDRHHEQVHGRHRLLSRKRRLVLRACGAVLLLRGLVVCTATWGSTVGSVAWFGWLSIGAVATALVLNYRPRRISMLLGWSSLPALAGSIAFAAPA